MNKIKKNVVSLLLVAISLLIIIFSAEVSKSIYNSINVCISAIIPSMFAYMVLSSYIISSGICRTISKPLYFILHRVIKLDEDDFCVFIMSLFGGYPVGAKLLNENISENKNYSEIAEIMICFCYCISPSFAVSMLGLGVFGSADAGIIIYLSNVISCIICAAVMTRIFPVKSKLPVKTKNNGIIGAINSTTSSLALISAVIISFNILLTVLIELLEFFGINADIILLGVAEISNLLKLSNVTPSLLPLISAIASFGGICVLCQCSAILRKTINLKKFLISRILCSILSGIITAGITQFWEISVETGISPNYSYSFSADKLVTVVLISMSVIIFIKSEKIFKKV